MAIRSNAREALEAARYFLKEAEHLSALGFRLASDAASQGTESKPGLPTGPEELRAARHNLAAAIVFGRAATAYLEKEHKHRRGFEDWFKLQTGVMAVDPLFKFMNESRVYDVHLGPIDVQERRGVAISVPAAVALVRVSESVRVAIGNADPEGDDNEPSLPVPIVEMDEPAPWPPEVERRGSVTITGDFHFGDQRWRARTAVAVIREYLDKLEPVITQAEAHYGDLSDDPTLPKQADREREIDRKLCTTLEAIKNALPVEGKESLLSYLKGELKRQQKE